MVKANDNNRKLLKYDSSSSITIKPTAEDDNVEYACEAKHPAIPVLQPMRQRIKLSVFCKFFFLLYTIRLKIIVTTQNC